MTNYLVKILITILFSFLIAFFYYQFFPGHIYNFDWYIYYLIPIFLIYGIYKYLKSNSKIVNFSLPWILGYFLLNLFILCLFFYWVNDFQILNWDKEEFYPTITWISLFIKIIFLSIFPIILVFLNISFWRKISKLLNILNDNKQQWIYNFLLSLWIWFFSFLFLVTIIWFFWIYNLYSVFWILLFFVIFWIKEVSEIWNKFLNYRITFENHNLSDSSLIKNLNLKLLSTEFLFIIASIILAINLISIMRPMPIGWDDLWAYMNYPRQMANSGMIDFLGGMYSWQVFTWIWFMVYEPVQAFFLNNVWWFLSFIVIILVVSDLLKDKTWKVNTLINIPLLVATIFISMPMVVFQQAKDMKLDEGLFFISVIVFYLVVKKLNSPSLTKGRWGLFLFLIIWILAWFAFSIKITSLLLISAIIWIIFYNKLWFLGFLWYLWIYSAIFTKAWLWSYLNIVYDKWNIVLINKFSFIFLVFWIVFLWLWIIKYKKSFSKLLQYIWIFILWILIAISPWIWKNLNQLQNSKTKINIWSLLWGQTKHFKADFTKILSAEELNLIKEKQKLEWLNSSWTTTNEDWGRYFWYEKGLNNYIKLPWNLTMQVNQGWEFTTLTWLFLALIPILFLFLKFRKKWLEYFILLFILWEILLFIIPSSREFLTNILTNITLPYGYFILFLVSIIPILFLLFSLKDTEKNSLFKINLIFAFFYILLFSVSAYWVVWYWIVMYFSLLLMISIPLYNLCSYKENYDEKKKDIKLFWSFIILIIFLSYFFLSVFPYSFNSLKNSWQEYFKAWKLTPTEAIFIYHPEYQKFLFNLNIDKNKLQKWQNQISLDDILNPDKTIANESKIYRIWTFLKYFINWNNYRLFEDSLVTEFDKYFYNKNNVDNTVERMKKIWLKYLLVDLNAATIDNDPRHDLTRRYENLLKTFTSDKLELIETDSICLKIALEDYNKSKKTEKDLEKYIIMAWVNYNSFLENNKAISKSNKLKFCESRIIDLVKNKKVDSKNYSYLKWIKSLNHWWKVLFEIK